MNNQDQPGIGTTRVPNCLLCGAGGLELYRGLQDRLFGAPGIWNLAKCPNKNCGLIWLDPQPKIEDIHKAYLNYYTHSEKQKTPRGLLRTLISQVFHYLEDGYLSRHFGSSKVTGFGQRMISDVLYLLPKLRHAVVRSAMGICVQPGGRILDLGCGDGDSVASLNRLGWQAEGIDVDPDAVRVAQSQGLKVTLGKLEAGGYPDDYFDAVAMNHVIEHVHDPLALLQECRRILKPSGRMVITTPNVESLGHKIFRLCWVHLDPPRHLFLLSSRSLRALVEQSGFTVRSLVTLPTGSRWLYTASRSICRNGFYKIGVRPSYRARLGAEAFFWLEFIPHKLNIDLGEEIFLLAENG